MRMAHQGDVLIRPGRLLDGGAAVGIEKLGRPREKFVVSQKKDVILRAPTRVLV